MFDMNQIQSIHSCSVRVLSHSSFSFFESSVSSSLSCTAAVLLLDTLEEDLESSSLDGLGFFSSCSALLRLSVAFRFLLAFTNSYGDSNSLMSRGLCLFQYIVNS